MHVYSPECRRVNVKLGLLKEKGKKKKEKKKRRNVR
jgi:hypothetical protein